MKSRKTLRLQRRRRAWGGPLGLFAAVSALSAADTNTPPATVESLTPEQFFEGGDGTFNNWIDFAVGGFSTHGSRTGAQQRHQSSRDAFGGVEDFHYQGNLDKTTTLALDGRALFDQNDYKLSLDITREKLGFVRISYSEFRSWYDAHGGYYPPASSWYPHSDHALSLDRGEFNFEVGFNQEKKPKVILKYTHGTREGQKSSTIWGITHPAVGVTQGLSPSFYDLDERRDAVQLDVTHTIKSTDLGVGLRYEHASNEDALKLTQSPGEPAQRRITDRQGTRSDLFNAHAFSETWIKKNLLLSSGYSYTDLDNTFSGSRIYGSDFDVGYVPAAQDGFGYFGLGGGSRLEEHVFELSLLYRPSPTLSIAPSVRVQQELVDAQVRGIETLRADAPAGFEGRSDASPLDIRERIDLTYTGLTNCVLFARGEWTEGTGSLNEGGGLGAISGIGVPPIQRRSDNSRFFQKYSTGIRLYPSRRVVVTLGGYVKINRYEYQHRVDDTANDPLSANRYPGYLAMQGFRTYDGNARLTVRPLKDVTLVSRYEYQRSTVDTTPDPLSDLGRQESAEINSHILAQDISWIPWSRLSLQASFNYVLSKTQTPVVDYTSAILDSQNNYWTMNYSSTVVLDDKSDLSLGYFYYRADNYSDNSSVGVPYGAGADEHSVTATLTRRIRKNLRLTLRYGYVRYNDATFGGGQDFSSHVLYSSLRYRF